MTVRKAGICIFLLCFLGICGGCQKTPQEVLERMDSYGTNNQMESQEIEFYTLEELKQEKDFQFDFVPDNMKLPEHVDFSEMESIEILHMSDKENYLENQEKILELFGIDKNSLNREQSDSVSDISRTVVYDSSADRKYSAISDDGFVSFISGLSYEYIKGNAQYKGILAKYDLDTDDISGKKVEFADGEADIALVRDSAERWLNENMPLDYGEYHISDAYVRELEFSGKTEQQLSFYVELSHKGIRFNSYGITWSEEERSQIKTECYGHDLTYDDIGKPTYFSTVYSQLKVDSVESVEKIVSLKSAVRLVNEEMSGFQELKISKVIPLYVLYPVYITDDESSVVPGPKVEVKPVYAFIINKGSVEAEFGITKSNAYRVFFVDMVTGELTTNIGENIG